MNFVHARPQKNVVLHKKLCLIYVLSTLVYKLLFKYILYLYFSEQIEKKANLKKSFIFHCT